MRTLKIDAFLIDLCEEIQYLVSYIVSHGVPIKKGVKYAQIEG